MTRQIFPTRALKEWFFLHRRDLPWRRSPSPYHVWISEIMLQQTQVAVVIPYYRRWMERFPNIESIAKAELTEVIKLWEGLGYYSRARAIHSASQEILVRFNGDLPSTLDDLLSIKGIGPYTAGAILNFAYHKKAVAIDGNVARVLSRYFGVHEKITSSKAKQKLHQYMDKLLPEIEPHLVTEAIIELGALVCQKRPDCNSCPLKKSCYANQNNSALSLPNKEKRAKTTLLKRHVGVITCNGQVLIVKQGSGSVMADLWEFPYIDQTQDAQSRLESLFKCSLLPSQNLPDVTHTFTRYKAHLQATLYETEEQFPGGTWAPISSVMDFPFSSGHRKIAFSLIEATHCEKQ